MTAQHSKYYPLEVLEKDLLLLEKLEQFWTDKAKQEYSEKYKDMQKKIKELKEAIENLWKQRK